jgi:hypothetical protein
VLKTATHGAEAPDVSLPRAASALLATVLTAAAVLGATAVAPAASADPPTIPPAVASPVPADFWLASAQGDVWSFGAAGAYGSAASLTLAHPIVGITPTTSTDGYWLVASDGGVFAYGDAGFYGSTGAIRLNRPVVALAPTPDGLGYWLVASDGGIFAYGDAGFYGSTGAIHLSQPIVGMAPTPDGLGYWLVASDGGIFAFGDAGFYGSTAASPTLDPAQRVVPSPTGQGYWIVDQNGNVNPFGDATGAPPAQALMFRPVTPGDKAVLFAFAQLGKPYIWGGNGPVGYDCSGLALASWQHGAGVSFARVSDDQYHTAGQPVALSALQAGDLVFWGSNQTDWTTVYHTGIYVGGGRIVEATGDVVQLNSLGQWGTSDLMPVGKRP